ncbi:hypothetical protein BDV36DRAFT_166179 [Aspergillus pseudocaelatus]|uniref:Uncharacterized protein n=1 Tax=Aspergillus pseudocaelatus TaxID=1825620 RepID=A0ABQ6WR74_9EURO|nr:hypothetical protein BDV36DRAFT_166179 [Aspergillus pseudocaelatus]
MVGKGNSMFSDGWKSEILSTKIPPWLYILKDLGEHLRVCTLWTAWPCEGVLIGRLLEQVSVSTIQGAYYQCWIGSHIGFLQAMARSLTRSTNRVS